MVAVLSSMLLLSGAQAIMIGALFRGATSDCQASDGDGYSPMLLAQPFRDRLLTIETSLAIARWYVPPSRCSHRNWKYLLSNRLARVGGRYVTAAAGSRNTDLPAARTSRQ